MVKNSFGLVDKGQYRWPKITQKHFIAHVKKKQFFFRILFINILVQEQYGVFTRPTTKFIIMIAFFSVNSLNESKSIQRKMLPNLLQK